MERKMSEEPRCSGMAEQDGLSQSMFGFSAWQSSCPWLFGPAADLMSCCVHWLTSNLGSSLAANNYGFSVGYNCPLHKIIFFHSPGPVVTSQHWRGAAFESEPRRPCCCTVWETLPAQSLQASNTTESLRTIAPAFILECDLVLQSSLWIRCLVHCSQSILTDAITEVVGERNQLLVDCSVVLKVLILHRAPKSCWSRKDRAKTTSANKRSWAMRQGYILKNLLLQGFASAAPLSVVAGL